ncbi:class I SAM-dependent methyltransferase, partial [Corallococcus exiguus]|nr:class I SAM-dependent methyltransferase [Corallococcus exiguus]
MNLFRPLTVFPFLKRWSLCLAMAATAGACRSETKAEVPPAPVEAAAPQPPIELHGVGGVEGVDAAYDRSRQPARFVSALE